MNTNGDATHATAARVLDGLKQAGLSADPRYYELWYIHASGQNSALSAEIAKAADESGKITQFVADTLYREHLQRSDLAKNVVDIITRMNDEVADLTAVIEKSGEHATGNNETLGGLADQLRQSAEEYPAVSALLENVVNVAKDMRAQNEQLEGRLAESADEINSLHQCVEDIEAEAMRDSLTGVANRARFDRTILQLIGDAESSGKPLTLMLGDIDHFKKFNDQWGHQTGDQVLRLVAEVISNNVRNGDTVARYGGEEFAILLPEASLDAGAKLAERIRHSLERQRLTKRKTKEVLGKITMSIGVAEFDHNDTIDSLIERADKCLYAAKDAGRNCVLDENALSAAAPKSDVA